MQQQGNNNKQQGGQHQQGGMQQGGGNNNQQGGGEPEVLRNLMVNYIPTTIDENQLRQLFEMYGPVESIKIVCDRETRTSKGYGFVKFRFGFSAVHAIQYLNGYPLMNKRLKVAFANQTEAQGMLTRLQQGAYGGQQQGGANAPGNGAGYTDPAAMQQQLAMQQQMTMMMQMQAQQAAAAQQWQQQQQFGGQQGGAGQQAGQQGGQGEKR